MDDDGLEDIEISQFMKHKTGWNKAWVNDEFVRGYTGELQNFMDSIAYDMIPDSGFSLAYDTARIVYAAYQSAEEGKRVNLDC
ncbi:MAG: Gfo/Idh/MocA family oxidoreductase [Emergencia sp.]